ncbi:MAG TPA: DUF2283 domain-containing protein [Saprospiraceae bacterium]|nr:DUF2283 domain-containing protein [Saprospiraceae bacterium]
MKVTYFQDTDTLFIALRSDAPVATHEFNENVYVDLDAEGKVVAFTIEHASVLSDQPLFSYETVKAQ